MSLHNQEEDGVRFTGKAVLEIMKRTSSPGNTLLYDWETMPQEDRIWYNEMALSINSAFILGTKETPQTEKVTMTVKKPRKVTLGKKEWGHVVFNLNRLADLVENMEDDQVNPASNIHALVGRIECQLVKPKKDRSLSWRKLHKVSMEMSGWEGLVKILRQIQNEFEPDGYGTPVPTTRAGNAAYLVSQLLPQLKEHTDD